MNGWLLWMVVDQEGGTHGKDGPQLVSFARILSPARYLPTC